MTGRPFVPLPALLLLAAAAAGCLGGADSDAAEAPVPQHTVSGHVFTPAFNPIPGVEVTLEQPGFVGADGTQTADLQTLTATTDGDGAFRLHGVWQGERALRLAHPDYVPHATNITVPGDGNLTLTLTPATRIVPYQEPHGPLRGFIECGVDHLIYAGSCHGMPAAFVPQIGGVLQEERVFFFDVTDDWHTIVIDIGFDPLPPTLDKLRLAAYTPEGDAQVLSYDRYAAAADSQSFTLRIEPGVDYGHPLPAPENATTVRLEVFPQGHYYHDICDPTGLFSQYFVCFTGVGVNGRIEFEILATVFYHEAAPEGWTTLQ